jgi:hypothetical protein
VATPFSLDLVSTASLADVLSLTVEFVAEPEPALHIRTWRDGDRRTFVGLVLVSESLLHPSTDSQHEQQSSAVAEVRIVTAIDTDGRHYQGLRTRGDDQRRLTVDDTIRSEPLTGEIPYRLSRLVTAVQNL